MITDPAIDEALIEVMRTKKALEALRRARKEDPLGPMTLEGSWTYKQQAIQHAAAKRASLDLTRSLAKLRAGK